MSMYSQSLLALKQRIKECDDHRQRRKLRHKRQLYLMQRGCCYCCKERVFADISIRTRKGLIATIEHIECYYVNKNDKIENKVVTCYNCNQHRGTIPLEQFIVLLVAKQWDEIRKLHRIFQKEIRDIYDERLARRQAEADRALVASTENHAV